MEEKKQHSKKPSKKLKALKILRTLFIVLFLCFIALVLFIRSPWGQNLIVDYATSFVSDKTHTTVEIDNLYITLDGDIKLKGLYLEDTKGDTLIYSKSVEADLPLWPIIKGNGVGLETLDWEGLRANITRKDSISGYNFQFLIDAFATKETPQPETEAVSEPLSIIIGAINLKDFNIIFNDAVLGIDSHFKIGKLELDFDTFNLETMDFRTSNTLISNSEINYIQSPVPPSTDTTSTTLPYLGFEDFKIKNVKAHYASLEDGLDLNTIISDFYIEDAFIDLPKSNFSIEDIGLNNSEINFRTTSKNTTEKAETPNATTTIEWPELIVEVNRINLENNTFIYTVNNTKPVKNTFKADALFLNDFIFNAENIYLKDKTAGLNLEDFSFNEGSGLNLKKGKLKLEATDKFLKISDLDIALNNTKIQGNSRLDYPEISALANTPEASKLDLKLPVIQLDINDVYRFQPDLKNNAYVDSLSHKLITGQINGSGYLSSITLQNTSLNWGKNTQISATGLIENATDPDNLKLNISPFKATTLKSDLLQFVNEKDLGINLPDSISLSGTLKGTLQNIKTEMQLKSSQGLANLKGSYNGENDLDFTSDIEIKDFKLNELLQNENLGTLNVTLKASGSGSSINNIDAKLDAMISSFKLKNYEIVNLPISGELVNGKGQVVSKYKDQNVNIDLQTDVVLDSISPQIIADLNIIGIDLQALGFVQKDIRAGLKLHADFKGNAEAFDLTSTIDQGTIVYNNSTYLLGDINANAHVNTDTTYVSITNKLLSLELASNANPQTFSKALEDHIRSYFFLDSTQTETQKPVQLKLTGKLSEAPVLNDVFLPNLKNIDTVDIDINFNQTEKLLNAKILAPHINYGGNELDSLAFTIDTDPEKFVFDLGFKDVKAGPVLIKKTRINGNLVNHEMDLNMSAFDDDEVLMQLKSKITGQKDQLTFHIFPEDLIVNKKSWQMPSDNAIIYSTDRLNFNNFSFSKNNESVLFSNTSNEANSNDEITIAFENFDIKDFLAYLNPEKKLAQGVLNGNFTVQNPFDNRGYLADLSIEKLNVLDTNFGTLTLSGDSETSKQYNFKLATKSGDVDLDMKGDYSASETDSNLNVDLVINEFKMKALEGLSLGEISETSGAFSGDFEISGSLKEPQYNGDLVFNDAQLKVTKLNSIFSLTNETLNIDNSGIRFSDFTIKDENKSTFVLNGLVGTKDFINPTFDLTVNAEDFQVLNATKEENEMVYGLLSFNAKGSIKGDLNVPVITINADVNPKTNVSYVMPSAAVNIEERDGVVIFVNRDNPDAILTRNQEETSDITGFDIKANFSVSKEAKITLVLDESTGDNFETSGEGDFVFRMDTNGRINLSGVYTVASGHYEMSLYELVKRRFELVPGSRVTWSGNPLDANLDVQAMYNIKASASPLMASQISGSDPSVQNKYKQILPFEVYLNIDGELMHPKISFNLDMPEQDRGAISGQVYGYLQQVNQVEGELNRQVFSLLVMGRFYPEAGSDGSTGGFESIARDNLNDAISDQLNMFSNKLLGSTGLELDFGLNSYTDYQGDSPEQRTQLDVAAQKKLFNDRIIVRVGSEVDIEGSGSSGDDTPLLGDISLEYLITPSGKYRLRAFQENEYESVIDGQTIVSGLALIFTREFNTFRELWKAILHSDEEKAEEKLRKEQAKADKKAAKEDSKVQQKETTK
ncbi:translocation/assembly module TamB domain-containing protein [Formosa sp. PL04]|uniref:translocation/assembly module TamB domain-containing protein n=1 Tax=Formosa sp. PL04 TaxID=3081755 RepID=UPI002980F76A|nr:translocation/assembly module TamB domain-containing protein [Formosa sp. PL04]MDW5289252.1 translocation/assembly module TamB domain-containing protein [Formosa sp. PL04]